MKLTNKLKQTTNQSVTLILLIGILIVVNIFSYQIFYRWDLTRNKIFSISDASKKTVGELPDVINVKAYFSGNLPSQFSSVKQEVADILDEYQSYSNGKMKIEFIDPGEDEKIKQDLAVIGIPQLTFQVFEKDKAQLINGYMGLAFSYGGKTEVIPAVQQGSTDLEYKITTAIKKATSDNLATIGFLTGQGEVAMDSISSIKTSLEELYTVQEIDLKTSKEIPASVSTLVIAGPKDKFSEDQLKAVNAYLVNGGAVLVLLDGINIEQGLNVSKNETGLEKLLAKYGVKVNQDAVGDTRNGVASFTQGYFTFSTNYPYWPKVTNDGFDKNNSAVASLENVIFPWAASIDITDQLDKSAVTYLAVTTDQAWHQTDNFNIAPNNSAATGDVKKFNLAVAVNGEMDSAYPVGDKKAGDKFTGRLVVVGDSDFIYNNFVSGVPDNMVFFQNLIDNFSLGSDLITIRSKNISQSQIKEDLSEGYKATMRYLNVFGLTIIVVAFGIVRYYLRRRSKFVDEI